MEGKSFKTPATSYQEWRGGGGESVEKKVIQR